MSEDNNDRPLPDTPKSDRPFGPNGPRVTLLPDRETPRPHSQLSSYGLRILNNLPRSEEAPPVGDRTLIERIGGLGDYSGSSKMIDELVEHGYLNKDENGRVSLTEKGRNELR